MEDNKSPLYITNEEIRGIDMNQVKLMQLTDGTILLIQNETVNENQSNQLRARPLYPLPPKGINKHFNSQAFNLVTQPKLIPKPLVRRGPQRGMMTQSNGPILRGIIPNMRPAIPDKNAKIPVGIQMTPSMPLPPGSKCIFSPPLGQIPSAPKMTPSNTISPPQIIYPSKQISPPQIINNAFRAKYNDEKCDLQKDDYQCNYKEKICNKCGKKYN